MKILHTSDWHLGKYLEKFSRIEEQKMFVDELEQICNKENVDLIIVAGDIYDTVNPPIEAERLFYYAIKKLSLGGKRPIVIISGNHDSGDRIVSSYPLAMELGIILIGSPKTVVEKKKCEFFEITSSGEGFFEIALNGEKVVFLNIPYPTEKNLNEIIFEQCEEANQQRSYSEKIKSILDNLEVNFKDDTINIVTGHFFVTGGKETESERKVQSIGGIYSVSSSIFSENIDYVALGHLHRPQQIKSEKCSIYYSGSPIQYSKSEAGYEKSVYISNFKSNKLTEVQQVKLTNYKPIEIWKCKNYDDALQKCIENGEKNCWVYLEIKSEYPLMATQLRRLREEKQDIVNITVSFDEYDIDLNEQYLEEKSIEDQFREFYNEKRGTFPKDDIVNLFLEIIDEMENLDETITS